MVDKQPPPIASHDQHIVKAHTEHWHTCPRCARTQGGRHVMFLLLELVRNRSWATPEAPPGYVYCRHCTHTHRQTDRDAFSLQRLTAKKSPCVVRFIASVVYSAAPVPFAAQRMGQTAGPPKNGLAMGASAGRSKLLSALPFSSVCLCSHKALVCTFVS